MHTFAGACIKWHPVWSVFVSRRVAPLCRRRTFQRTPIRWIYYKYIEQDGKKLTKFNTDERREKKSHDIVAIKLSKGKLISCCQSCIISQKGVQKVISSKPIGFLNKNVSRIAYFWDESITLLVVISNQTSKKYKLLGGKSHAITKPIYLAFLLKINNNNWLWAPLKNASCLFWHFPFEDEVCSESMRRRQANHSMDHRPAFHQHYILYFADYWSTSNIRFSISTHNFTSHIHTKLPRNNGVSIRRIKCLVFDAIKYPRSNILLALPGRKLYEKRAAKCTAMLISPTKRMLWSMCGYYSHSKLPRTQGESIHCCNT